MGKTNALRFILAALMLTVLIACSPDFEGMGERRQAISRQNQDSIEIVAVQAFNDTSAFVDGVLLAVEEINQRPKKLLQRSIKVHIEQSGATYKDTKSTIRRIVANPNITAVLGHRRSSIAVPASVVYELSQVIFMTPFATAENLTGHGFKYVFRMAPNNAVMSDQLASVARSLGYKRIVSLYARDDLNRENAFMFEDAVIEQGIKLVKSASFFAKDTNYRPIISQFNNETFDAVFIASGAKSAGVMASQLREMGINVPIIGNDSLNKSIYTETAGDAAENTIVPSIYRPDKSNAKVQYFIQQYQKKYKTAPDYNAAQGYDSMMLLATAIERAGSTLPPLLSSTLHYMPAWVGITGIHAYDEYGELKGKKYHFKVWQDGRWYEMPAIHVPYLVQRFTQNQQTAADYPKVFSQRTYDDEHKANLLSLAQDILKFKRIGVIYEKDGPGAVSYSLLESFASSGRAEVVGCEVPFSKISGEEIDRALIACYGQLSLSSDVLFLPPYGGKKQLIHQLNGLLSFFTIPAISLDANNTDTNVSLLLAKRRDVNVHGVEGMQLYSSLLKGLKVHEFAARLQSLPEITVNLVDLQYQGFPDSPILDLSPDDYRYPDSIIGQGDGTK